MKLLTSVFYSITLPSRSRFFKIGELLNGKFFGASGSNKKILPCQSNPDRRKREVPRTAQSEEKEFNELDSF